MVESEIRATRKGLKGDRVAICPKYGCDTIKRLKPMKFGIFGIRKYPKCNVHNTHLVFVEEFIGDFLKSVNACLYDISALPPEDLQKIIKISYPEIYSSFFHRWLYCSPLGRGADNINRYLDSLSKAYLKSLSKKQQKSIRDDISVKKRAKIIVLGFKKIEMEYIEFLKKFYEISENSYNLEKIKTIPSEVNVLIQKWLNGIINAFKPTDISNQENTTVTVFSKNKEGYDQILNARTCMLFLGKDPNDLTIRISIFELFMAYRDFLGAGLCKSLNFGEIDSLRGDIIDDDENDSNFRSDEIEELRNKIRNIDWEKISSDWIIEYQARYSEPLIKLLLNPKKDCSKEVNPLFRQSDWLGYLYNEIALSYRQIAEICNVDKGTIIYWAKKHGIPKREELGKEWIDKRGYINIYAPEGYFHPELTPVDRGEGRYKLMKHRYVIEKFLLQHPKLEISKKCMIEGKYLKSNSVVHHVNFNKLDNRIENLWVFENQNEHQKSIQSLYTCFSELIKLSKITFTDGAYILRNEFKNDLSRTKDLLKPRGANFYKDINNVKSEIKKINWKNLYSNWTVKYRQNQFQPYTKIQLDQYSDCSEYNPLYRHKGWLEVIVNDNRFNLSDSRLGPLCGITKDKARGWRRHLGVSRGRDWGFKRLINKKGRVFIKPENYSNPVALRNRGWILEHRYTIEQFLNSQKESSLKKVCLDSDGFLKSEIIIHHLNFDPSDNRIENLYILFSESEHKSLEFSLLKFVEELIRTDQIRFLNGKYHTVL